MAEPKEHAERLIPLTATDLKQWAYCKRIVYYRHVMPVKFVPTYKMERGRNVEAAVAAMEKRRGFRRYGLQRAERRFGVWLSSPRLGLSGRPDLLIVTKTACYPVDFKDTEGGLRQNHRLQLAVYAILAEEQLRLPVPAAFVYLVPSAELMRVAVGQRERAEVLAAIEEIEGLVSHERMPEPTPLRGRCVGCEFRNYCDDIW
jgi:CRISPR-associated exonuclease Cas4